MKNYVLGFTTGLLMGCVVAVGAFGSRSIAASAAGTAAQTGAAIPGKSRIVLENDRVRVKDVTFTTGSAGMHTHDLPHVGVVIQGGTLEFKYPDGKSETAQLEAGGVGFREANVTHEPVNPGKTPVRVIEVELK